MKFYTCAYCEAEVTSKVVYCPNCGKDIYWRKRITKTGITLLVGIPVVFCLILELFRFL